jgi:hypothetical protein
MLFYFTDNMVTYYIVSGGSSASPELQKLICRIKYLELLLSIRLEVVHIPGLHMIDQRTDGLSHGIRFAGGCLKRTPEAETLHIFEGVPTTPAPTLIDATFSGYPWMPLDPGPSIK